MDIEDIVSTASILIEEQKKYLDIWEEYFEFIKYRNITRVSEIEHLLDSILSMFQTNETLDLYTRVCLYYHAIDKEGSRNYANFYLEMYDDDRVIKEINKIDKERKMKKYGKI